VAMLGDKHLPADVERSNRVFNPNAMFSPRPPPSGSRPIRRQSGVTTVGLGLAHQGQLAEVSLSDIFDLQHHVFIARAALPAQPSSSRELIPSLPEMTGLGAASLAVGAFTVGGKALGLQSIIEGMVRLSDIVSNPASRRWIGPIVGVVSLGAVAYVIYELPRSIPRNVGRHLQASLLISSGLQGDAENVPFAEFHSARVGREVRKVMRLAAWDLRERYRGAMNARAGMVKESEEVERKSNAALSFFAGVEKEVENIREMVGVKV